MAEEEKNGLGTVEDIDQKVRKHMTFKVAGILFLLILVVGLVAGLFIYQRSKPYSLCRKVWAQALSSSKEQEFLSFRSGILSYSKNGITYYDSSGREIWSTTYSMNDPRLTTSGEYLAVFDAGAAQAVICSESEGYLSTVKSSLPVTRSTISSYGVLACIGEDEQGNHILFYDKTGRRLEVDIRTLMSESGYPLDIGFSPNGQILMASFVYLDSGVLRDRLVFYNFNEGKQEENRIVGGFTRYGDTIFPEVIFLNDTRSVAFGDGQVVVFSLKNKVSPEEICVIKPEGKVLNIAHNDNYFILVTEGDGLLSYHSIRVYDLDGSPVSTITTDFSYDDIYMGPAGIYLKSENRMCIFDYSGKERYRGAWENDIDAISPGSSIADMILVSHDEIVKCELRRESLI